jgi:hypothetical protein
LPAGHIASALQLVVISGTHMPIALHISMAVQTEGVFKQLLATQIMFTQVWLEPHSVPIGHG